MIKVNINDVVKVKLTEHGIDILKKKHKEFFDVYGVGSAEYEPKVDEQGYASFQIHRLIEELGPYVGIGKKLPFETEIIVLD